LKEGTEAFLGLVGRAVDPLAFALRRAEARFAVDSIEGSRQAAEWVLDILARVPRANRAGLDVKVAKALDALSQRLRVPVAKLDRRLAQLRRSAKSSRARVASEPPADAAGPGAPAPAVPIRIANLDVIDRQLIGIILNQPNVVGRLISRVAVASIRDAPLRAILQACYDLYAEGSPPTFERVAMRLEDPAVRALAAGLLLPIEPAPLPEKVQPAPWEELLAGMLARIAERDWQERLKDIEAALKDVDSAANSLEYQALRRELYRHHSMRPDTKRNHAS
jgi:DNA primase